MKHEIYNGRMCDSNQHLTRIAALFGKRRKRCCLGRWSVLCNVQTDKLLNEARPKSWRQSIAYLRVAEMPKAISILLLFNITSIREAKYFSLKRFCRFLNVDLFAT